MINVTSLKLPIEVKAQFIPGELVFFISGNKMHREEIKEVVIRLKLIQGAHHYHTQYLVPDPAHDGIMRLFNPELLFATEASMIGSLQRAWDDQPAPPLPTQLSLLQGAKEPPHADLEAKEYFWP